MIATKPEFFEVTFFNTPESMISSGWGMITWREWCDRTLARIKKPKEKLWIHTDDKGMIGIVGTAKLHGNQGYQYKTEHIGVDLQTMTPGD